MRVVSAQLPSGITWFPGRLFIQRPRPGQLQKGHRMIGTGGKAVVGQKVAKVGEKVGRWTIQQAEEQAVGWRYELKGQFGGSRWVSADAEEYELLVAVAPTAPVADQLAYTQLITNYFRQPPGGDVKDWLSGKAARNIAAFARIGDPPAKTGGEISIVWSGGASDCVIIGMYTGNDRAQVVHLDRTSDPGYMSGMRSARALYLASEKFTLDAAAAACDGLVAMVLKKIVDDQAQLTAVYPSKQLAMRDDGVVLASFDPAPLALSAQDGLPQAL